MSTPKNWDSSYEFKAILLLTLAFGLVGLDRFILPPLFPTMMGELGLTYADLGGLVGILALAWGVSAIVMGYLSDRLGRRKVLVPAIIGFSLASALSGSAQGLVSLLLIRALMGAFEGPVASTGVAVAVEASHPKRRGMNNGMFQCMISLMGLAVAPILATQLLEITSWRNVFLIVGIPGLIIAAIMWFTIREPLTITARDGAVKRAPLSALLKHRNVPLAMVTLLCAMSGVFILAAFIPNYLIDYLKLTNVQMGYVTSAIGFGGFLGQLGVPALSDFIGRRFSTLLSFLGGAVFLYLFAQTTAESLPVLFTMLFFASLFAFGALAVIAGPIAAEAAPLGLIASVSGLVIGVGEIFGGGIAPRIAGSIAQSYGIQHTLKFALYGLVVGLVISLFLRETAPRRARAASGGEVSDLDRLEESHPEGVTQAK
jgi:predicted MFS family arabinose efflux permease